MKETHLARVFRNRAAKYDKKVVFKHKIGEKYVSITWKSFIDQSDQVAKYLINLGVQPHDTIGIYSQNFAEWTISDVGILSARAVVVPVYATSTYDQLKYIVEETRMKVLFVGEEAQLKNALKVRKECRFLKAIVTFRCSPQGEEHIVSFHDLTDKKYPEELNNLLTERLTDGQTDDLATIIYTSGTSGEPKGVMLNHSHFIHTFKTHDERLDLNEKDVSMCFLPLSHIFERAWTYLLLHSGAVNVFNTNPKEIISELPRVKPTVMCAVPRFFEKTYEGIQNKTQTWSAAKQAIFNWAHQTGLQYIAYQKDEKKPPLMLVIKRAIANSLVMKKLRNVFGGKIRFMPCAGAALDNRLLRFFHAMGIWVNYGYGATETTATVSCMRSDVYDFDYTGDIMPGVEVKISEEGMILVKGDSVFAGYYKKPEATAEVLKDGWYYTGDQGSLPEPGKLHMTERIKDIIKTSTGKFISPQKIELVISKSNLVDNLCVIGDNRRYLTALIVPVYDKLFELARKNGIDVRDKHTLVSHRKVISLFYDNIIEWQRELPPHEKVVKFTLLPEPFSIDNQMLTNSLKVRRKEVNKAYSEMIDGMY